MELLAAAKANKLIIQTINVPDWIAVPNGTFEDEIVVNTLQAFADQSRILRKRLTGKYKLGSSKQK